MVITDILTITDRSELDAFRKALTKLSNESVYVAPELRHRNWIKLEKICLTYLKDLEQYNVAKQISTIIKAPGE